MNRDLHFLLLKYIGLTFFMYDNPGYYGLNSKRTEIHKRIEKYFIRKKDDLKYVLHNLSRYMQPKDIIWAINNVDKFRREKNIKNDN